MSVAVERRRGVRLSPGPSPRTSGLPLHWPLTTMLLGFPLWWVLGIHGILPILLAVPMVIQLVHRRRLTVPPGLPVWLLFLLWVALGVFVLFADAPGAVPGGGPARILVFGYQFSWYLAATVVFIWIHNMRDQEVSTRRVRALFAYMFVVTTFGGLLGVVAPTLEFPSLLEALMPRSLSGNGFVNSIVHPGVADVQNVLGTPEARPQAPFAFANSWGANFALFLPYFVIAWVRDGTRWQRLASPLVLLLAMVPVIDSLNRGLWGCLALGAVLLVLVQLSRGQVVALVAVAVALPVAVLGLALSPLGETLTQRLENPHSNERRGSLLIDTVESAWEGSPIVGFGNTRDVQGSYASIAGASTPDCPACGVPPLGTQGQLWLVIFSQGIVGCAIFLVFLLGMVGRAWRCRTTTQIIATFVLAFTSLQLFVYDTLGIPWLTVMATMALLTREKSSHGLAVSAARPWNELVRAVRSGAGVTALLAVVGLVGGAGWAVLEPTVYDARVKVLPERSPTYLEAVGTFQEAPREVTIDTEAALVIAEESLSRALGTQDADAVEDLRQRISITAAPNSRVLVLSVQASSRRAADEQVAAVAKEYLVSRSAYLAQRKSQVLALLRDRLEQLDASGRPVRAITLQTLPSLDPSSEVITSRVQLRGDIVAAITELQIADVTAGEVIQSKDAQPRDSQPQVPLTSGLVLGLAAGLILSYVRRRRS